jgi:GNAT superfamily N-acetyltransferase
MLAIRTAQVGEATMLTALCVRSKAHGGYDAEFMRLSAQALRVGSSDIALGRVLVAVDGMDRAIGVASVIPEGQSADLDQFFIDPSFVGRGVGRVLFEAAARMARSFGATTLTILADPNAAPFYERLGARFLQNAPSDAIPGRSLPLYEYDLTSGARS